MDNLFLLSFFLACSFLTLFIEINISFVNQIIIYEFILETISEIFNKKENVMQATNTIHIFHRSKNFFLFIHFIRSGPFICLYLICTRSFFSLFFTFVDTTFLDLVILTFILPCKTFFFLT